MMNRTSTLNRRGAGVALLLALLLGMAVRAATQTRAQTVTAGQLSQAALADSDVPGLQTYNEQQGTGGAGFGARFTRFLRASDGSAALMVDLHVADASASADALRAFTNDPTRFTSLGGVSNVQTGSPLGIGDTDQTATWSGVDPSTGAVVSYASDVFLLGRVITTLVSVTPSATPDTNQLATYAQAQLAKLQSSLPADLTTTVAVAAATSTPAAPFPTSNSGSVTTPGSVTPFPGTPRNPLAFPPTPTNPSGAGQTVAPSTGGAATPSSAFPGVTPPSTQATPAPFPSAQPAGQGAASGGNPVICAGNGPVPLAVTPGPNGVCPSQP